MVPIPLARDLVSGGIERNRAEQYAKLFPAMIGDWRKAGESEISRSCSSNSRPSATAMSIPEVR